jgi:hypothetical protein
LAHRYFCTYFDQAYLTKGVAMIESLLRHTPVSTVYVLCLDSTTMAALERLPWPSVRVIGLYELEAADNTLAEVRGRRGRVEFYWTLTPILPLFLLERHHHIDAITYLDADLYFFSDPEAIYRELGEGSIYITPHRFSKPYQDLVRFGIYNVAAVTFRHDASGLACLRWWREKCLDWCGTIEDQGRFGDQKYLDCWPTMFEGVVVSQHSGCNLAPWNIDNYRVHEQDGTLLVDNSPLVFYHYHGFRQLAGSLYELANPAYRLRSEHRRLIYRPYIRALKRVRRMLTGMTPPERPRRERATLRGTIHAVRSLRWAIRSGRLHCDWSAFVPGQG